MTDKEWKQIEGALGTLLALLREAGFGPATKAIGALTLAAIVPDTDIDETLFPMIHDWIMTNIDIQMDESGVVRIDALWPTKLA